jgi:hypothetical protein
MLTRANLKASHSYVPSVSAKGGKRWSELRTLMYRTIM